MGGGGGGDGALNRHGWLPAHATERTAWELESEARSWLARGWSFDVITTTTRGGVGIAKDLVKRAGLEVDLGAYATLEYEGLFRRRFDPQLGVGLGVSF